MCRFSSPKDTREIYNFIISTWLVYPSVGVWLCVCVCVFVGVRAIYFGLFLFLFFPTVFSTYRSFLIKIHLSACFPYVCSGVRWEAVVTYRIIIEMLRSIHDVRKSQRKSKTFEKILGIFFYRFPLTHQNIFSNLFGLCACVVWILFGPILGYICLYCLQCQ